MSRSDYLIEKLLNVFLLAAEVYFSEFRVFLLVQLFFLLIKFYDLSVALSIVFALLSQSEGE